MRMIHTPKNGSWLNMAEMELSLLSRPCLGDRRFATATAMDATAMDTEITAWQTDRNTRPCGTNWRFTTTDARLKLKSLYPILDIER